MTVPATPWSRIARQGAGDDYAEAYAERFRRLAESGADVHGEAAFVGALVPPPARVLDASCGTGRVAVRLAQLGYDVLGCDVDTAMVEVARRTEPGLDWRVADLTELDLGERFDLVVLAGNVIPLLEPGTLPATMVRLAAHLADRGLLVCGFGTDPAHLPGGCPVTTADELAAAAESAGLVVRARHGTWQATAYVPAAGYLVVVLAHRGSGR